MNENEIEGVRESAEAKREVARKEKMYNIAIVTLGVLALSAGAFLRSQKTDIPNLRPVGAGQTIPPASLYNCCFMAYRICHRDCLQAPGRFGH